VEPFTGAHRAQTQEVAPSPREPEGPQEIDPGTLRGGVFGGFGVKHERTTDLSRWAAAARSATSALVCVLEGAAPQAAVY
jgi:hypothetical protein